MSGESLAGRYQVFAELACGGMAMVYLGQLEGIHGFKRPVAIKRMHAQYARDPEFSNMFLDEARLVAKIRHPNVVPTLDVVSREDSCLIVMEFVEGESVSQLMASGKGPVPPSIAAAIAHDALCGLHAAHELPGDDGELLGVVHRDVSPANILVGKDGLARILDFGVAKATGRDAPTKDGSIKGKIPYMPPEQLWASELDRTVDVYAMSVVLWEMLTGRRLFKSDTDMETMKHIVEDEVLPPSHLAPEAAPLDAIVMRGLSRDPSKRFQTALEMAKAIAKALHTAPRFEIGDWVGEVASAALERRSELLRQMRRGDAPPAPRSVASLANALAPTRPTRPTGIAHSVSQARDSSGPARPRRGFGLAAGSLLVFTIVGVAVAMRTPAFSQPPPEKASAVMLMSATLLAAEPRIEMLAPTPSTIPPPTAEPAPHAIASASASAIAAPPPPVPPERVRTSPPRARGAETSARAASSCRPPYTLDAEGNRHFKVECL